MMSFRSEPSKLLELLNERRAWTIKGQYQFPEQTPQYRRASDAAIRCIRAVDDADPFVAGRLGLHLERGYCLPSEVLKDCHKRAEKRRQENKPLATAELIMVKAEAERKQKKADMDRAWGQYHALERRKAKEKAA